VYGVTRREQRAEIDQEANYEALGAEEGVAEVVVVVFGWVVGVGAGWVVADEEVVDWVYVYGSRGWVADGRGEECVVW
jgi:hypothetical protein